eukprot:c25992_g1_i1.p1 GENE.c25992_g1_i1~~c25992_g1_i1.p1  ORF type:complete len:147 (+),score=23.01 c25992_g1_i1:312-752(+)
MRWSLGHTQSSCLFSFRESDMEIMSLSSGSIPGSGRRLLGLAGCYAQFHHPRASNVKLQSVQSQHTVYRYAQVGFVASADQNEVNHFCEREPLLPLFVPLEKMMKHVVSPLTSIPAPPNESKSICDSEQSKSWLRQHVFKGEKKSG